MVVNLAIRVVGNVISGRESRNLGGLVIPLPSYVYSLQRESLGQRNAENVG